MRRPIKPANLPSILPPEEEAAVGPGADLDMARTEEMQFERDLSGHAVQAAALRNKLAEAYIANLDADRLMRQTYAARILRYLEYYSGAVATVVLLDGAAVKGFNIETEVLATLVGSTAVAAIGLVGFIARGLFRSPPAPPPEKP